jgi:hypothetical protein
VRKGIPSDDVSITFSEWFSEYYGSALEAFKIEAERDEADREEGSGVLEDFDELYRVRSTLRLNLNKFLGPERITSQTFIPAGRAFFTSIGRLVAGLEYAGSLDPLTIKFARHFGAIRERSAFRYFRRRSVSDDEHRAVRDKIMNELFGGEIRFDDDADYVESSDGRVIPFSSLSSGQQELLPMWSVVDYFNELEIRRPGGALRRRRTSIELLYIEEPEAHLFPSAQSQLMDYLISSIKPRRGRRSLIITTHSPYIMSKLNVYLKAGQLSRWKKKNREINKIVPRDCWLRNENLSAWAIQDGRLVDLVDEDGLIDSLYLDEISEEISRTFSQLLAIEAEA